MPPRKNLFFQPFQEQIGYFSKKVPNPQAVYKGLAEDYHDYSFSIAGLTRADLLADAKWLMEKAIKEGDSFETFQKQFDRLIGRKGWRPTPDPESKDYSRRLYTIFDTNKRQSHRAGRYQQAQVLDEKSPLRFRYWVHRDSPNFRKNHKALHMAALEKDDPFWDKCLPSCGWGCWCDSFLATEKRLNQLGARILSKAPDPETIADPDFMYIPGSAKSRAVAIESGKKRLPKELSDTVN